MKRDLLSVLKVVCIWLSGIAVAVFICIYSFGLTAVLSYRLVVIFLCMIFVSNLGAKLWLAYFENRI